MTYQNLLDAAKVLLRGKFIGLPQETREISNNLMLHLKELEKEKQTKPQVNRRKEIIKIGMEGLPWWRSG